MRLEWVQKALTDCLGYAPFPATLNVRPAAPQDLAVWEAVCRDPSFFAYMPSHEGSCSARIFRVEVRGGSRGTAAAVLLPDVTDYPRDKIEIVAPIRLKDAFGVEDGDRLTLEFLH